MLSTLDMVEPAPAAAMLPPLRTRGRLPNDDTCAHVMGLGLRQHTHRRTPGQWRSSSCASSPAGLHGCLPCTACLHGARVCTACTTKHGGER